MSENTSLSKDKNVVVSYHYHGNVNMEMKHGHFGAGDLNEKAENSFKEKSENKPEVILLNNRF